ncbi:MAG: hypothetical protein Fur0037_11000 [Planctomycetota bacterium]
MHPLAAAVLLASCLSRGLLPAAAPSFQPLEQGGEARSEAPVDPYTGGDPDAMARAGVVSYGPLPWADGATTRDVDRVLGQNRILWMETEHFRIGSNLRACPVPTRQESRKYLQSELREIRKKLPKVAERARKLDPWLRLHLYARRAEQAWADFSRRMGVSESDFPGGDQPGQGKYLGLPDKFLLLLFHQESDLARYMDRFCGVQADKSYRFYTRQSHQMLAAVSAEGLSIPDDLALFSHVVYCLAHNFASGYRGFYYELPAWFEEGLAQCYARAVPTEFVNVLIGADDIVDEERQHLWPQKVRARVRFDHFPKTEEMLRWTNKDLDFIAFVMSWSRVDFLESLGDDKLGIFFKGLKSLTPPAGGSGIPAARLESVQRKLLAEVYGFDADSFDAAWKRYVLKHYPQR